MSEAISKMEPNRPWVQLAGVDGRGACAAWVETSATGGELTGEFVDQFDFAVLRLIDADCQTAPIDGLRPLPDFDMAGVTWDVDVAFAGCYSPTSVKFDSLNAAKLSYITKTGSTGTVPLAQCMTSITGGAPASVTIAIGGTIAPGDVFQIIYLGNFQFVYTAPSGATPASVASGLTVAINLGLSSGLSIAPFAVWDGASGLTIYAGRSATSAQFTIAGAGLTLPVSALAGFWGLQAGDVVMFVDGGSEEKHTVASVTSPWSITLDSAVAMGAPTLAFWPLYSADGNSVQLMVMKDSAAGTITPSGAVKLTGGAFETSLHWTVDFSALGVTSVRQAWLTIAPVLNLDSAANNATLKPFEKTAFSATFSSWTVTGAAAGLKVAGPGSVVTSSRDVWGGAVVYAGSGWAQIGGGNVYCRGFARSSAQAGDSVTIRYRCEATHDLLVGTELLSGYGTFHVALDGGAEADLALSDATIGEPLQTRRTIVSGVAAGTHTVKLTLASSTTCIFDYLQAAVRSDVEEPAEMILRACPALDYDNLAFSISPEAMMWTLGKMGYAGALYFYKGVFFGDERVRSGGSVHAATVAIGGTLVAGDGVFLSISGIMSGLGVGITALDTLDTVAQRFVNAINTLFVGVWAAPTGTAGEFVITCQSPLNGFALTSTPGASATIAVTGDIGFPSGGQYIGGQEGAWAVDASNSLPLNSAFAAWLAGVAAIVATNAANAALSPPSITGPATMSVAVSDEDFAPVDANTSGGAAVQRYADGTPVLTATGFGTMGAGYVEAVSTSSGVTTIQQTGHGYVSGNRAHFASASATGGWVVTLVDADHYSIVDAGYFQNSTGSYVPAAGDTVFIELQTCQLAFNPTTTTALMINRYVQIANILAAAGVQPELVHGEVGWWFFSQTGSTAVGFASFTSPISIGTAEPHGMVTGQTAIVAGVQGNTAANGTWTITVTDGTHFTLNGSSGNGNYVGGTGTATGGGGMAFYDAYTTAQATASLGRALAQFWTSDDSPAINAGADAGLLRGLLYDHLHAIAAAVKAAQSTALMIWLVPMDVWAAAVVQNAIWPFPQGGRLNNAINIPTQYTAAGSDIDAVIVECLSYGASYRDLDQVKAAIAYMALTMGWARASTTYLLPWFNAGCPFEQEVYHALLDIDGLAGLIPFAIDQQVSMGLGTRAFLAPPAAIN